MVTKQIIGFVLLAAFLISMVAKFIGSVADVHDNLLIIFFVTLVGGLLFLGIRQILRD